MKRSRAASVLTTVTITGLTLGDIRGRGSAPREIDAWLENFHRIDPYASIVGNGVHAAGVALVLREARRAYAARDGRATALFATAAGAFGSSLLITATTNEPLNRKFRRLRPLGSAPRFGVAPTEKAHQELDPLQLRTAWESASRARAALHVAASLAALAGTLRRRPQQTR
ncbi:anthrone oxygenase family protein [Aeromicrobium sp. PE09-221]|uniref:anthrone oxygenase family protein n=1 Tax=Aeromicrobium sp. PE09-221 TaxID=1898043 RepID=UPI0014835407|nr:anthrone oxygenase family protein [Aeromicrobium sp. PE09-221]